MGGGVNVFERYESWRLMEDGVLEYNMLLTAGFVCIKRCNTVEIYRGTYIQPFTYLTVHVNLVHVIPYEIVLAFVHNRLPDRKYG